MSPGFTSSEKSKIHFYPIEKIKGANFDNITKLHCTFCGGKSCKHENWKNTINPAI
jgi:hypothetical protein